MTEDEMSVMLAKLEALASKNADLSAKLTRLRQRADTLDFVQRERDRLRSELKAAEAKIEEWFDYSQAWAPLIPARRRKELKASVPKPLETDIPF
jgi:DNA repair exonuclease SbcCD ATPase subunit